MRGRTPRQVPPTVEQMAAALAGKPGLFMFEYWHDDYRPTIRTQRWENCTCAQVDHHLRRYNESECRR